MLKKSPFGQILAILTPLHVIWLLYYYQLLLILIDSHGQPHFKFLSDFIGPFLGSW